jgi:tetratricopeptide (TPR) repeat protein
MRTWKWLAVIIFCALQLRASDEQSVQQASQLLEAGKTRDAKVILQSLLEREPQNAEAHELMGDAIRHEGNGKAAEREYRRAMELGLHDSGLLSNLATVQKWNRHFSEARTSYRRELEVAPFQQGTRDELQDLEYQRGFSLFGAYGGWETDSTTKGWEADLSYRGLDHFDTYAGLSYADKFFYTRRSYNAKAYAFFSPTGYVKLNFEQDSYDYPVAITPVPDANAYQRVPTAGIEVSGDLRPNLRGTISYEFFRPNFFFDPSEHASNHKLGGELLYKTNWKPLQLRVQSAVLRDPDPNRTLVDKVNRHVVPVYGMQYLVGGGADLSFPRFDAQVLVLPNRDLDRSTDYSFLSALSVPLSRTLKLKSGYIYDHYSNQSAFTGKTAQVYNLGFSWKMAKWMELSVGGKAVRRPIRNDQAVYVTTSFRLPLR